LLDSALLDEGADYGALEEKKGLRHQVTLIAKPQLPDPRLIRRIIRQRQLRDRFFNNELFADPVWDMLLDLAAATTEGSQVSITSLCIASRVPPTTALRWITVMTDQGLLRRTEDPLDRRRAFISLTDDAIRAIAAYFAALSPDAQFLA
jgi:DNA-binding MarR family transcriptional regulator